LKKTINGRIVHIPDGRVVAFAIHRREQRRFEDGFGLIARGSFMNLIDLFLAQFYFGLQSNTVSWICPQVMSILFLPKFN
jgi:hypothetical protein